MASERWFLNQCIILKINKVVNKCLYVSNPLLISEARFKLERNCTVEIQACILKGWKCKWVLGHYFGGFFVCLGFVCSRRSVAVMESGRKISSGVPSSIGTLAEKGS